MAEILVQQFEIAQGGADAVATYVNAQIGATNAKYLLAMPLYQLLNATYAVVVLSNNVTKSAGQTQIGVSYQSATFNLSGPSTLDSLAAWMNAGYAGVAAPALPVVQLLTAGTLTGQGTMSIQTTYVTPLGESAASAAKSQAVTDNHELQVVSPALDAGGLATGYNVYIGGHKQNANPIAIGSFYTQNVAVSGAGAATPTSNGTALKYFHDLKFIHREGAVFATVTMSN